MLSSRKNKSFKIVFSLLGFMCISGFVDPHPPTPPGSAPGVWVWVRLRFPGGAAVVQQPGSASVPVTRWLCFFSRCWRADPRGCIPPQHCTAQHDGSLVGALGGTWPPRSSFCGDGWAQAAPLRGDVVSPDGFQQVVLNEGQFKKFFRAASVWFLAAAAKRLL